MSDSLAQRVLIIGPSNIGDAILIHDVIAAVHHRFPDAHLALVVGTRATAFFAHDPRIQSLVDADAYSSVWGRLRLLRALWRYHPHIVVDLRHTIYPLLLNPWGAWRYVRQPPKTITHMRDRHFWKLRAQVPGLGEEEPQGELWLSPEDVGHVDGLWHRWQLEKHHPLVVICPGARSHLKRWTTEGFARVADRLIGEAQAQVVFSGEPDEEPVIESIIDAMTHPARSTVGLTTIRQLGALMRRAQLVITNDSASLHLASAVHVPTVAIFGPTDAAKYGPTSRVRRIVRRQLFCAPCEQALCRFNHECMRFISADEVFIAAQELLSKGTRRTE